MCERPSARRRAVLRLGIPDAVPRGVRDPVSIVYSAVVLSAGAWGLWRVHRALRAEERSRHADLAARSESELEPVHTTAHPSPRQQGYKNIEARFTVHRRLLMPLVGVVTLILAAVPFLSAIPATLFSVMVAVITVAVGVAARPILENAFAGLMMSFSRVVRVGDTVRIGDWYGSIEDISSTHTTIRLWDWKRYVVPNSLIIQKEIINYSIFDQRLWAHVEFWVSWDADIALVRRLATEAAQASPYCEQDEAPTVWVMSTDKEAISLWVAAWAKNAADAWMLSEDMRTRLVEAFQKHGITTHDYRALVHGEAERSAAFGGAPAVRERISAAS